MKGKGKMTTYFLLQNLNATEEEIMGIWRTSPDCSGKLEGEVASAGLVSPPSNYPGAVRGAAGSVGYYLA